MKRNDYRRYKKIKEEIAQLHQDMEDVLEEIHNIYIERKIKEVKVAETKLHWVIRELELRETIREELLLPKYVKTTWVGNEKDMPKGSTMDEYLSMFLTDNYNHNVYGFWWVCKGKDVYITNIRWNQNQILACDLKKCLKGEIGSIRNGEVEIYKDSTQEGVLLIKDITTKYVRAANLKQAIKELEDSYYM